MRQQRRINQSGKHTTAHFFPKTSRERLYKDDTGRNAFAFKMNNMMRCLCLTQWAEMPALFGVWWMSLTGSQQTFFFNCKAFFSLCCALLKALDSSSVFSWMPQGNIEAESESKATFFWPCVVTNSPHPSVEDAWKRFLHKHTMHVCWKKMPETKVVVLWA